MHFNFGAAQFHPTHSDCGITVSVVNLLHACPVADLGGGGGEAPPPLATKLFSQFHAVFGKF